MGGVNKEENWGCVWGNGMRAKRIISVKIHTNLTNLIICVLLSKVAKVSVI